MGELGDSNSQVNGHLLPKDGLDREVGKGGDGHGDGKSIVEALSPSAPILGATVSTNGWCITVNKTKAHKWFIWVG